LPPYCTLEKKKSKNEGGRQKEERERRKRENRKRNRKAVLEYPKRKRLVSRLS
jgi:hypothetical protein